MLALRRVPRVIPGRAFATYIGNDGMTNYSLINWTGGFPTVGPEKKPFLGSNILLKWLEGFKHYGVAGTFLQAYTLGDVKFGTCVGTDVNGNQYFENTDYPHGQHRWVVYRDIHNYDAAAIPPEWHGWMCHMVDAPGPDSEKFIEDKLKTKCEIDGGDECYDTHLGYTAYEMDPLLNYTNFRKRGYKIGSIKQLPDDPDAFHVHAGHALNKGGTGRYLEQKGMHLWNPEDPEGEEAPVPTRSLAEN